MLLKFYKNTVINDTKRYGRAVTNRRRGRVSKGVGHLAHV